MNKNRNLIRKRAASIITCAMLGASMVVAPAISLAVPTMTAFAHGAEAADPAHGTITVSGMSEDVKAGKTLTVTAYQIVDGVYTADKKISAYTQTVDATDHAITNLEQPTEAEVTAIANDIEKGIVTPSVSYVLTKQADGTYTADVDAGLYVVLVTGAEDTVYNPGIVALNVTNSNNNAVAGGNVNMADYFKKAVVTETDGVKTITYEDWDPQVYLKKSSSDMDKDIVSTDAASYNTALHVDATTKKGDTVTAGGIAVTGGTSSLVSDTISFSLNSMTIPSFSAEYEAPEYKISDTLETGKFNGITNLSVKVNGAECDAANYTLTAADGSAFTAGTSTSFLISFKSDYLRGLEGKTAAERGVEVTYDTSLTANADENFEENMNRAELNYSDNPNDTTSYKTIDKNTYHYTFGIDSNIDGTGSAETHELNKVTKDLKASGETGTDYATAGKSTVDTTADTALSKNPLAGAVFTLYSTENAMKNNATATTGAMTDDRIVETATSDANGHISFRGLDQGTYYMKETTAPTGYTMNTNVYQITISGATYDANGALTAYSVTTKQAAIDNTTDLKAALTWSDCASASYTATPTVGADGSVTEALGDQTVTPAEIVDTKLKALPSTGGQGTRNFMILAIALAGGFVVFSKATKEKKKEKEQA